MQQGREGALPGEGVSEVRFLESNKNIAQTTCSACPADEVATAGTFNFYWIVSLKLGWPNLSKLRTSFLQGKPMTFSAAKADCQSAGTELASFPNRAAFDAVTGILS